MQLLLPQPVEHALRLLEENGYAAYAVGGCVRDRLMGREPADWDIASSALPGQLMEIFSGRARTLPTGLQHGTLTLMLDGWQIEATTFRIDGCYTDHRRPDRVAFTSDIGQDLARRDFTVNAMAYSPLRGFADPFDGRGDLSRGLLRCVGDPAVRFQEDALRILRGVRFISQLGFSLEEDTKRALFAGRELLREVSAERLAAEMGKLLCGPHAMEALQRYRPVLAVFLPELSQLKAESWTRALRAVGQLPACLPLRFAALLHGAAGLTDARQSARCTDTALRRLRYDNRTREAAVFLVENWNTPVLAEAPAVRRWLCRAGEQPFRQLLCLQRALCQGADASSAALLQGLDKAERLADAALLEDIPLSPGELAISGYDLLERGIPAGPQIGRLLRLLHGRVLDGKCENSRDALLSVLEKEGLDICKDIQEGAG